MPQTPDRSNALEALQRSVGSAEELYRRGQSAQGTQILEVTAARIQLEIACNLERIFTLLNRLLDAQEHRTQRPLKPPKEAKP